MSFSRIFKMFMSRSRLSERGAKLFKNLIVRSKRCSNVGRGMREYSTGDLDLYVADKTRMLPN